MSLRARLLAGMAVVALVLIGSAVAITRTTEAHLVDQVDDQLHSAGTPTHDFWFDHDAPNGGPSTDGDTARSFSSLYVGVVDPSTGTIQTLATPNISDDSPPAPKFSADEVLAVAGSASRPFTVGTHESSVRYRLLPVTDTRTGLVLVLGLPLVAVDAAVHRLIGVEVFVTILVLLALAVVTYWVNRLGVRPIKQMTATASAIAAGDMSHRVPDVVPRTEAGALGLALNQMLERIEEAFAQQTASEERLRRFVGDASHELRTPVTTIRGYAELYRSGGLDDEAELREAMRRTEQEAVRMGSLIDDLLLLARLDQGRPLERSVVDLSVLATDAVRDAQAVAPDRPITAAVNGRVNVIGDDSRLRQVIGNLVRNAVVHTPPGTPVTVRVIAGAQRAAIEVEDEGPGMSEEIAARAFERFYRADPARSRHRGGTGLGLAIVQATVAAHGGTVALRTGPGEGSTFRVELPAAERAPALPGGGTTGRVDDPVGLGSVLEAQTSQPEA